MAYSDAAYIVSSGTMSEADLAGLFASADDTTPTLAEVSAAIAGAIAPGDAFIDSCLRRVYSGTLPLASPPEEIKKASAILLAYEGWSRRITDPDENPFRARWKQQTDWLKGIAQGLYALDLSAEAGGTSPVPSRASNRGLSASDRTMTPVLLKEWM